MSCDDHSQVRLVKFLVLIWTNKLRISSMSAGGFLWLFLDASCYFTYYKISLITYDISSEYAINNKLPFFTCGNSQSSSKQVWLIKRHRDVCLCRILFSSWSFTLMTGIITKDSNRSLFEFQIFIKLNNQNI